MPTRKLSFRLDEELAERLKTEAESRGETMSAAASRLITCALDSETERPTVSDTSSDSASDSRVADLHDHIETLKAQLAEKDRQIASLTGQQADLARVAELVGKVADQAQQLHALAAKTQAADHDDAEDVSAMKGEIAELRAKVERQDENKRRGWLSRLFG